MIAFFLISSLGSAADSDTAEFLKWTARMEAAVAEIEDVTYTFYRRERVDGKLLPPEEMNIKFRPPRDVYMLWTDRHKGREILYRQDWNENKMRVNAGSLVPTLNLDPQGKLAMRGQRHGVEAVGFEYTLGVILGDDRALKTAGFSASITDHGVKDVLGEPARCFTMDLPKDQVPAVYAHRVELCVNLRTNLPSRSNSWERVDDELLLMEEYSFGDIQVNTGLTDADFDPGNNEYRF